MAKLEHIARTIHYDRVIFIVVLQVSGLLDLEKEAS